MAAVKSWHGELPHPVCSIGHTVLAWYSMQRCGSRRISYLVNVIEENT
jgi:hypothetical protein